MALSFLKFAQQIDTGPCAVFAAAGERLLIVLNQRRQRAAVAVHVQQQNVSEVGQHTVHGVMQGQPIEDRQVEQQAGLTAPA